MSNWTGFDFGLLGAMTGAFGFAATGTEFAVGLCMGISGALAALMILRTGMVENAKPLSISGTLLVGVLFAIVAGQAGQYYLPDMPISLTMFAGGFLSSFIGPGLLKVASVISRNVPQIVSRMIESKLPKKGDGADRR